MAQPGAELAVLFDDGCVVVNDVEFWVPPNTDVSKVGTLIAFLETQDGLRGKGKIVPYSAKKRKITSSSMVAYVVLEADGSRREERKDEPPSPASPDPAAEDDAESQERAARLDRIRKDRQALEERRKRIADQKGQVMRANEETNDLESSAESAALPVGSSSSTAGQGQPNGDDGLMSKLWKAAGSWFGGEEQGQQPGGGPPPPAEPASPSPRGEKPSMSIPIYDIPPLAAAPTNDEMQSPRVVVIQGPRAIPKMAAPSPPPPQPQASSPPVSPRGPKLSNAPTPGAAQGASATFYMDMPSPYGAQVAKMFPRAASPSPDSAGTMARQPRSASPTPASAVASAADNGGTIIRQRPVSPSISNVAQDSGTMMRQKAAPASAPMPVQQFTYDEPRASIAGSIREKQRRLIIDTPEFCFARRTLLDDLVQHAKEKASAGCIVVLVPGMSIPAGSGKTCVARKLAHLLQDTYKGSHAELSLGGSSKELLDTPSAKTSLIRRFDGNATELERNYQGLFVGEGYLRNGVLILDDARSAEQVLPLLPISFDCCIIVTSRVQGLSLQSESMRLVEVGPINDVEVMKELPQTDPAPALRSISRMYNGIAANLLAKNRAREAEEIMRRVLAMRQKLLGDLHADVASSMVALASVFYRQQRYNEAEGLYRAALAIQRSALGETHKDTGQTLNNLASSLTEQGKHRDAEELYRSALITARRAFGDQHPDTASVLQNLASVLTKQRKLDEAETALRQAVMIRRNLHGEDHKDTASALGSLANLLDDQGKFKEAEDLQRQAAASKRKVFGDDSAQHAAALDNLAATLCNVGNYAEAEKILAQAHNIRRKLYGDNHPETQAGAKSLAAVRKRLDQPPSSSPLRTSPQPDRGRGPSPMPASEPRPISPRPMETMPAGNVSPRPSPSPISASPSPTPINVMTRVAPAATEPQPTPYKCGWLTKRGNGVKTWKRRWFVLRNDVLNYMEHETAGEPKGSILMNTVLAVEPGDKKPFCLALVTGPRTYYIVCKDHAELGEWLAVLKSIVARLLRTRGQSPQRAARP